ncbi:MULTISPECIES: AbrB/MazE/SpoVT family DNA-binding domain-containing protein [unclassified Enterococcus]|uniref:AbrB/MazE/SpoVT family DNA-binding domain-containing protein n=1 Tax=unclassified Enterococcus TaxID=2608891 RepID=UPI001CE08C01|nr:MULTISPECIES: AbrB/MazE/SpoVT family DNA-binding domain-containing protein [unclassified Enterococcus]MCA5011558.1 AbrB/MazE/SpoVT family DNA-binding domain-containing protein [Enterococcus sp. S23]MCA5015000.1 AbrB/MazE/SpoVT family DNA-binding domain-containing protein [Enterococcus sp. S22(2020)]
MSETIKKTRKTRKQGNTYITSLPKEVIQALSLHEGDKLEFVIRDGQVLLEKPLSIKSDNVPDEFYDDIDFFMNKHDQAFKNLVEK